ncbi:S8 family serine peptidase [Paenibacillus sp. Soil787]|uniref:S53 family peptidase n=1 Tax=Paenibacillus sp. Soil787 TaxID=1736411 RepID=UPI0006F1FCB1|nr:S53 family peptidase [Paenibacillus sp. Soil787]KRF31984.1 peptidase S8 and S53 subtilisin kexin sedolisin [Paenibacillus sp. Soil787]
MKKWLQYFSVLACAFLCFLCIVGFSSAAPLQDAHPPIHIKNNGATPNYQNGFAPAQIKKMYGLDRLSSTYTGAGQTIAIIDAYGSPTIVNDLQVFNTQFGLPPADLTIAYPNGKPNKADGGWALETSLDVEWAHAVAPQAKILLVVAKSATLSNLLAAVDYATSHGAQVVSNSWGGSEFSSEASYDSHFQRSGVVYVASSGDNGSGMSWPASSPYVLSVGGTTLNADSTGSYVSESGWSGSGGGASSYESRPSYEDIWQTVVGSYRGSPDVSWDADPNTGVAVYDSTSYSGQKGWFQVGGTSFGAPCWAAMIALADQGRSTPLTNYNAIANLYSIAGATDSLGYTNDYHDINKGSNGGYSAQAGYDLVTGIGSPKADLLIPALNKSK